MTTAAERAADSVPRGAAAPSPPARWSVTTKKSTPTGSPPTWAAQTLLFNTNQGCQFTSTEWTGRLLALDVRISMDGKGRWMDNVFIERLWRSVKYEEIYQHEHATIVSV